MPHKKDRYIAAGATAATLLLLFLWLGSCHLSATRQPSASTAAIELQETYVEVVEMPAAGTAADHSPAEAAAPLPQPSKSAEPKAAKTEKTAPSPQQLARQREQQLKEEARRQAEGEVAGAFSKAKDRGNTDSGNTDQGKSGKPGANRPGTAHAGTGSGTVGGGWAKPAYATVESPAPGSVKMTLTIDSTGTVTRIEFTGGTPPAATDPAVRAAVTAEVRRHRFRRIASTPPPPSTRAYITYTFK